MNEIRVTDVELIGKFKQLEQSYNGLKNSTSIMFATVSKIQNQQQVNKIKLSESLNLDVTTEKDHGATGVVESHIRSLDKCKISSCGFVIMPSLYHLQM